MIEGKSQPSQVTPHGTRPCARRFPPIMSLFVAVWTRSAIPTPHGVACTPNAESRTRADMLCLELGRLATWPMTGPPPTLIRRRPECELGGGGGEEGAGRTPVLRR